MLQMRSPSVPGLDTCMSALENAREPELTRYECVLSRRKEHKVVAVNYSK